MGNMITSSLYMRGKKEEEESVGVTENIHSSIYPSYAPIHSKTTSE